MHKAKASECGGARRGDGLTSFWTLVTCEACLRNRPLPIRKEPVWRCVERDCDQLLGTADCRLCIRCAAHCVALAPGDEAAHQAKWRSPPSVAVGRRRR
jgi:hypothetical protein